RRRGRQAPEAPRRQGRDDPLRGARHDPLADGRAEDRPPEPQEPPRRARREGSLGVSLGGRRRRGRVPRMRTRPLLLLAFLVTACGGSKDDSKEAMPKKPPHAAWVPTNPPT